MTLSVRHCASCQSPLHSRGSMSHGFQQAVWDGRIAFNLMSECAPTAGLPSVYMAVPWG